MTTQKPFVPELLSPAGSLKNMRYAFAYGADAVYAGQPRYSLRVRNNEFNHENLQIGIDEAHAQGKKLYVVCNIQPHNSKLKTFIRDLKPIVEMGPDALIMSDPGLIMMVREAFPEMPIHLSVQANAVNWATVKFWSTQGVERVILSRELSLEEIEEIREHCPETELEIFVHGALCMAYSGRCLLSGYMNKRDPNQGTCTNACRWEYKTEAAKEDENGQIVEVNPTGVAIQEVETQDIEVQDERPDNTLGLGKPTDEVVLLSESHKPEEKMAAFEDEHGTYIMNSKDLRAIQHVERLTKMGVHSLKIEGRTKSFYYCARTAQVYRKAIDDAVAGKPFDESLMGTLESLAHRGYTEGFLRRHTHDTYQNYEYGYSISDTQQFVGEFTGKRRGDLAEVEVKNKFLLGDSLEMMTPKGNVVFKLEVMENRKSEAVDDAKGNGHFVFIPVPTDLDLQYGLLMRNLNKGQDTRNASGK
ncbi:tRNA 5-hydroxyuridine modification protein YegQ [Vibrio toranzoniae]|uniref:tRNA hydroxylation protein P n=1 Tax=Vibrio toranzoniae TaxID=1194427 RepID=A0A109D913_9VIBR|nr:tRNA 5-hydroxyuridine modification protein YegQ [Vibrio toranzoniae]KWU00825.1 protease [Vibrio toranzoniae]NAZ54337.1 tRNA 5-hydroxyuridine modification protein YegQ [Vibrio toranzoniae]NAZ92605.1 tRNA 5-hydroxyuridine modification protein YegQ [Vibrio toranzoniae]NAZ97606.1 tRNA 5-hydroxyuridine modification protein YegQ [Vibrio toranzoniae]SBS28369.1 putative protease YhbU precursor [Vibrio toranzoniae]